MTDFSTEAEAFLKAIIEQPDDLLPRLVYADWLEEQGDPRAEFIRLQCEVAQPELRESARFALLSDRIEELLREHEREWNGEIHRALGATPLKDSVGSRRKSIRGWKYHRGFPEELTIRAETFLEHGEILFQLMPLREVHLFEAQDHLEAIAASPLVARLKRLTIRDCHWVRFEQAYVLNSSPGIQQLTSLEVHVPMSGWGVGAIEEVRQLKNLHRPTADDLSYWNRIRSASTINFNPLTLTASRPPSRPVVQESPRTVFKGELKGFSLLALMMISLGVVLSQKPEPSKSEIPSPRFDSQKLHRELEEMKQRYAQRFEEMNRQKIQVPIDDGITAQEWQMLIDSLSQKNRPEPRVPLEAPHPVLED